MRRAWLLLILAMSGAMVTALADEPADDSTRVLVTLSDPGIGRASRAGPVGPGYGRRSSSYLVSVNVHRAAKRIAGEFNLRLVDQWPIVALKVHCIVFATDGRQPIEELLMRLREHPDVESAQTLNQFDVSAVDSPTASDPYRKLQYSYDQLGLRQAHFWSVGAGADVTIIDTGADFNHPELKSQIHEHHNFVASGDADFTKDRHGTAVAGIIAAASDNGVGMVGVAPAAQLTVLRACWYVAGRPQAVCDSFTLAKALAYALETQTDVINLSLGGPHDPLLGRLVAIALRRNIVVVTAAPGAPRGGFPADVAGVIVVASGATETTTADRAEVAAPGDEILVPVPGGGYDYASGSSLAAAHVSGIAALLVASSPTLSNDRVDLLLRESRDPVGHVVNACRALSRLLEQPGCDDAGTVSQSLPSF